MCSYSWRVPSRVFGELKIVASSDLGTLGPQEGTAVVYSWMWYYTVAGLAIWLVLIIALIVPKSNRDIRILLILIPLAIVNLLWRLFMKCVDMNSTDTQQFSLIFNSMVISVAVLWLITKYLARFGGITRFLLSFVTITIVSSLSAWSYFGELSEEMVFIIVLFVFMALTMLIAITLSRRHCKGKYRPVHFMLWLIFWILLMSLVAMLGFIVIGSAIKLSWPDLSEILIIFGLGGLVFGLCLYVLNLPFMILGFVHPFFRDRFCACLSLEPEIPIAASKAD